MPELPGLVSTVIPTFNRADYLCEAIDSAISQDYDAHEIWVIDDGSTDETQQILQATYGDRINYAYQENQGQSAAKNHGVRLANGEFIATLDSDDRWLPGKLKKQIELITSDEQIGLVYTDKRKFRGDEIVQPSDQLDYTFHRGWALDELIEYNFIISTSMLARRRNLIEAGLFDESMRVAEDYALWLRIARNCKVDFVDEVLVEYRVGNVSIGESIDSYHFYGLSIIEDFISEYYPEGYPNPDVLKAARSNRYQGHGDNLLGAGKHASAMSAYFKALCLQPTAWKHYRNLIRSVLPNRLVERCVK